MRIIAAVGVTVLSFPALARNNTWTTTCGGTCNAYATITTTGDVMTIKITNLESNPISDADLISGISVTLGTSSILAAPTSLTQTGALVNITNPTATPVTGNPTHWRAGVSGSQIFVETAGPYAAGGSPTGLIIGPPGPSGYTNANNSISGHNPSITGTATFTLVDSSIYTNMPISAVGLQFSTSASTFYAAVAEPLSVALLGAALGGIAVVRRGRKREKPPAEPA